MQRVAVIVCALLATSAVRLPPFDAVAPQGISTVTPCAARVNGDEEGAVRWYSGPVEDTVALDQWCRGVGPPIVMPMPAQPATIPPALEDLVVVTWNAHLAEGRLQDLVAALRHGRLTGGRPVRHFVLLVQELYRRGPEVPAFRADVRSAFAIKARDTAAPDAREHARQLGLAMIYVPSMRNGAELLEDRGNAVLSTEPLVDVFALELPFERQRRVAVGAAVEVRTARGHSRLNLLDVHLEPLSSPSSLWLFRNPRRRQVAAILDLLQQPRFDLDGRTAGTIVGGDFNTVQGGAEEDAYVQARGWSRSLTAEDRRNTHFMGRLDYLFFRLAPEWVAHTARVDDKFGSDHHPVLGRFVRAEGTP